MERVNRVLKLYRNIANISNTMINPFLSLKIRAVTVICALFYTTPLARPKPPLLGLPKEIPSSES